MTTHRSAWPDESSRSGRICPPSSLLQKTFVAIEEEPVERLIGVARWRSQAIIPATTSDLSEAPMAMFIWSMLPRYEGTPIELDFLAALSREVARSSPATTLTTHAAFDLNTKIIARLEPAGFKPDAVNLRFEGDPAEVRACHDKLRPTYDRVDASAFEVISPEACHANALAAFFGRRQSTISPESITRTLLRPDLAPLLFDAEWSSILIEKNTSKILGAHLVKVDGAVMHVSAMEIKPHPQLLPGLGWFLILQRRLDLCQQRNWKGKYQFRVNPATSQTMLRLAKRFGYRSIGTMRSYSIPLHRG